MFKLSVILPLLAVLSMVCAPGFARAEGAQVRRCAQMGLDQSAPEMIGYSLRRIKAREIDINDRPVVVMPVLAGMKGPSITLLGRDVRLAVTADQTSPQELWHKSTWNTDRIDSCPPLGRWNWFRRFKRDLYWSNRLDVLMGFTATTPKILFRNRLLTQLTLLRPYGFMFGGGLALPLAHNTDNLLYVPDTRDPVRRDMSDFSNKLELERLYGAWHTTPFTDFHVGFTGGYIEEMYAGAGIEAVYRPFGTPFWFGADGWEIWRRKPSDLNLHIEDDRHFTGHLRAGYDVPFTRTTVSIAAGQYLAGDHGATLGVTHMLDNGVQLDAGLTWTDRKEDEGFIDDTHFDGMLRATWVPGKLGRKTHSDVRWTLRQVGRDGGQMIERPMPIENLTAAFSEREIIRHWPQMLDKKE